MTKDLRVGDTIIFSQEAQLFIGMWSVKPGVEYQIKRIDLNYHGNRDHPVAFLEGHASPYHFDYLELVSPRMMLQDPLFSLEELTE